jgi:hypothetical protein
MMKMGVGNIRHKRGFMCNDESIIRLGMFCGFIGIYLVEWFLGVIKMW